MIIVIFHLCVGMAHSLDPSVELSLIQQRFPDITISEFGQLMSGTYMYHSIVLLLYICMYMYIYIYIIHVHSLYSYIHTCTWSSGMVSLWS